MSELSIDVWSDIACPWCFVGKRRLEEALASHPAAPTAKVRWHSFELDPSAPKQLDGDTSYAERLARKYRVPVERGEEMIATMTDTGAQAGITMRFDIIQPGNTFDAHRLLHWAKGEGRQGELKERLLRAYLGEGVSMNDHAALAALAEEVGLAADEAAGVLASDDFAGDVRQDETQARELGIQGVPFFVFEGRLGVSGAQPLEVFHRVFDRALEERLETVADGAVCGPDGCA